jgi:hypothetical protein
MTPALERLRRMIRVDRITTAVLGREYRPNLRRVEIDITWECNLRCKNCDRSCRQAPTDERMTVEQIVQFVAETIRCRHRWERIALLGGEPTMHPDFHRIVEILEDFRRQYSPETDLVVVTNGHGRAVESALKRLPPTVRVKNTKKRSANQERFEPFNVAPIDTLGFARADFSNGCWITADCGIGLNRNGYYPCAVAGGIDRVFQLHTSRREIPRTPSEFVPALEASCRLCGHFLRGRFVAATERTAIRGEPQSRSWREAYARLRMQQPRSPATTSRGV